MRAYTPLLLLILSLISFVQCQQQQEELSSDGPYSVWDGYSKTRPADLQDSTRTFTIKRASDLAWLADATNNQAYYDGFEGYTIQLDQNLDLGGVCSAGMWSSNGKSWTPIGIQLSARHFRGTFNGNHHKIRNLYINNTDSKLSGLFGYSAGIIQDLIIESGGVTQPDSIGTRYQAGLCAYNAGIISGCVNKASVQSKDALLYIGGVCGYNVGQINQCENYGSVFGTGIYTKENESEYMNQSNRGYGYVGGICGYSTNVVSDSKNHGQMGARNEIVAFVGGICGYSNSQIIRCEQDGQITIRDYCYDGYIGGIAGMSGIVSESRNMGIISPEVDMVYCGGVVGCATRGVEGCENRGPIRSSGAYQLGGICGESQYIYDCINYVDLNISANYSVHYLGGIGGNALTVKNCINYGAITCDSLDMSFGNTVFISGVVCYGSEIRNCRNQGNIDLKKCASVFVGGVSSDFGKVYDCLNTGNISVKVLAFEYGYSKIGGISGGGQAVRCKNTGNVSYVNTYQTTTVELNLFVGGILAYGGSISECINTGAVAVSTAPVYAHSSINVGGISGRVYGNIFKSINKGSVSGTLANGISSAGGIVGYSCRNVYACKNVGEVLISSKNLGGIAGFLEGNISASMSVGNNAVAGIAQDGTNASLVGCFYTASAASGTTMSSAGCGQFSANVWPDSTMLGWGNLAPANWDAQTFGIWENPWTSLGSWNGGNPMYPIMSIENE